uniref:Macro domain-containing protein n=1 Tax=Sparus aurata TaxID=8175 RepID=A0A671UPE6_SPAAU
MSQPEQSIPAATPPPSGEKYERPLDSYLLQYLKECPKAEKELQEQLASVASAAQFFPDEERVLVRSSAQLSSVDEVGQWKAKVDQLFDVAGYSLCDGLQVLVCHGDITELDADALVNAANEDLDHGGGVAAALSKAGGAQVQKESSALVKQIGKIPTGEVVVTTGGDLNCKKLLHAVGPVGGKSGGRERALLEKTVRSALDLAEMFELESIAMPCISSGVFGVPVTVCSEAIVTAIKKFGSEGGRSLGRIILIDNRGEVVRAMQEMSILGLVLNSTYVVGLQVCPGTFPTERIHKRCSPTRWRWVDAI